MTRPTSNEHVQPGPNPPHSEALPPDDLQAKIEALREDVRDDLSRIVRQVSREVLDEHRAMKPLLSIKDVARTLGVSKRTAETLHAAEELPTCLWVGGQRRWHPDAIEAYVRRQVERAGR